MYNKIKNSQIKCGYCNSKVIIKKGFKKNKFQVIQKYQCKNCRKCFTLQSQKNITYPISKILEAISLYNLGYPLKQVSEKIFVQDKLKIAVSTISSWIKKYKNLTTYIKLRKQAKKLYSPKNIIFKKPLQHRQVYLFNYHKAKLKILPSLNKNIPTKAIENLKNYLAKIHTSSFPHHIFDASMENNENDNSGKPEQRSSKLKFEVLDFVKLEKHNYANKLAALVLKSVNNNFQRHQAIQNFMLINDTSTIATEIPVYLTKDDINYFLERDFNLELKGHNTPITGHIDILQLRNNLIHILDYKPNAHKINPVPQLTLYALALASRLQIPIKYFKVAWFDETDYFEYFPLHAVYKIKDKSINLEFKEVRK